MATRTNITLPKFNTRDEFESVIDEIARLQIQQKKLEAERDIESQKVLEKFNPEILAIADRLAELQNSVVPYATANAERLFGKARSASCSLAIYGFKKGNKKIVNVSGYADNIVAKELFDGEHLDCVEVAYKLNKKGIQKALKEGNPVVIANFEEQQDERFYVEAKTDKEVGE